MCVLPDEVRRVGPEARRRRDAANLERNHVVWRDADVLRIVVERQQDDGQCLAFLKLRSGELQYTTNR